LTSSEGTYGGHDERVLVLLSESRDAESMPRVLEGIGVDSMMCATPEVLCAEIGKGAGAVLIEEEILTPGTRESLVRVLENQPTWSELPIIVLLRGGAETQAARDALFLPGDVIMVERPVRVNTLVAFVISALRSRRRQYLVRDQLRALDESESRYRTLYDSIDEGFCIIEVIFDENDKPTDYRFLETNPSFEKQTGLINAQGKRMREFAPQLEEHWFEIYGRVALTGQPVRFQNRAEPLQRWFDLYAFRFGRPEHRQVAVLFHNINDRKQKEEEIKGLHRALEERAAELEAANRELETFNYTVAHDLRTPLTVISGYIGLVKEMCGSELTDGCQEYLQEAYGGTLKMSQLIDALLDFSGLARVEPKRESVDLSAQAQEILEELRLAEPKRQVALRIADGVEATGDPSLLRVVLANLLGNAWKFTQMRDEAVIEFGVAATPGGG
jgi:PAS domain-containing protein